MDNAPSPQAEQPVHDGYRVRISPVSGRVRAEFGGQIVAESSDVLVMHETRYAPVFYFPPQDVRWAALKSESQQTNCPFKGNASYWSLDVDGRHANHAAWAYHDPFDESEAVRGYVAFDWDAIDAWYIDDQLIDERGATTNPAAVNPLVDWILESAWQPRTIPDLLSRFADVLGEIGFPVWRVRLLIQTLNPQLFALTYTWQADTDGISQYEATHAGLQSAQFLDSPFATIIRGEGGIRRRLEGENPRLDFPILKELAAEGATDYVAVPMRFTDGQTNILVLVSHEPGGFSTEQLGQLYEILPNLSRLLEAHAQRQSSLTLLQTYLGKSAGQRVMDGVIKRGDGEELRAVIWMSDLRGSTALAETVTRDEYLLALNQYFDSVAGAVIENGGEVLKFIGDAVLAIFPIDDTADASERTACQLALRAAQVAQQRIDEVNTNRTHHSQPALAFGIGLHIGWLTYGNIGTPRRLDFTVIGSAVNEASRIEGLCRTLGHSVITSQSFAAGAPGELSSIGQHQLRGVTNRQELFTIKTN